MVGMTAVQAAARAMLRRIQTTVLVLLLAVLLPLLALPVLAQEPGEGARQTIRSGSETDYPPFCIVQKDGRVDGFSVELLRAALAKMGREVSFRTGPWNEVRGWLERGEIDALPLVGRTPEREMLFDFTVPYLTMHGAIVVRRETADIRNLADLRGRRVGVLKGDNAEEFLRREDRGFEILTTPTFPDAFRELAAGRCDAVVIQRLVAVRLLEETGLKGLKILDQPIREFAQDFCFAVKDGDGRTLAILNEGLALAVADGTHRRLHAKWFAYLELPADRPIIVGGDHNYPPFEFRDKAGRPAGYNVDLLRAVANAAGLDIRIRLGSWAEMMHALERGEIDAMQGMFYSPDRDKTFDFSQAHIVNHCVAVLRREDGPAPTAAADLAGKRIVVQDGDIMHEFCREQGLTELLTVVDTQEEALREVAAGKHDLALVARMTAFYWIEQEGWDNLVVGRTPLASPQYCFAVPHGKQALLAQLSEGLKTVAHSGEYQRVYEKWMGIYEKRLGSDVLKYVALTAGPLLVIIALALLWSWSLRRKVKARTHEVREKEAFVRTVLDNLPVGVAVNSVNPDVTFDYMNDLFPKIYRTTREALEVPGAFWNVVYPDPDFGEELRARVEADCGSGDPDRMVWTDVPVARPGEPTTYITARNTPIPGTPLMISSVWDVSERKRADEELARQFRLLRVAGERTRFGGWSVDLTTNTCTWSDIVADIHGMPHGFSPTVEDGIAFYAPDWRDKIREVFTDCAEMGIPYDEEMQIVTRSGEWVWVRAAGEAIRDEDGRIVQVQGSFQDISKQKVSNEAIRRSEEQYRLLADNTLDVIWQMTLDVRFSYVNPAIEAMFGFSPEEWIGTGLWEHCDEVRFAEMKALIESEAAKGPARPGVIFDTEMRRRDGSTIAVEIHARAVFDEHSAPVRLQGVTRDITERKRHETRLAHLVEVLRAIRNVNQLITHERRRDALLYQACDILTEARGYRSAWIAVPGPTDGAMSPGDCGRLGVVAESGIGENFSAIRAKFEGSDPPDCCRLAATQEGTVVMYDTAVNCVECPLSHTYRDTATLAGALRHGERQYGVLVVALPAALADDPEEQALFEELAGNIGYALFAIDLEEQRHAAEVELERSNDILRHLLDVAGYLTVAPDFDEVVAVIRKTARALSGADGVSVVLREGEQCFYVDEDAIEPLWKGQRFPMNECISGWVMQHGETVAIEDIYADSRIPHDAYRSTFVKSLALAPIRAANPVGAVGVYWKDQHRATETEVSLLVALGNMAASVWDAMESREALRRSEETLRAVLDAAPVMLCVVDGERRVLYANPAFVAFTGAPEVSPWGRDVCGVLGCAMVQDSQGGCGCGERGADCVLLGALDDTLKTGNEHTSIEVRLTLEHGGKLEEFILLAACAAIPGEHGASALLCLTDMTERRALEGQLRQVQKMDSVGQLAGGIAHDFNNMLTIILGQTQMLRQNLTTDDPGQAKLGEIHRAAERAATLTRQILAFARKQNIQPQILDLNDVIGHMFRMLQRLIGEDIDLVWVPGRDVWPVRMDPGQIDQILANLCINARDAIGGVGRVTIETKNEFIDEAYCAEHVEACPGTYVMLVVSDDGCGMEPDTVEHIFEPFYTTKAVGEGTGLGLATVYGIVKQNSGFINVYSEVHQGTTFRIYVPRHESGGRASVAEVAEEPQGGSETILLVEDEDAVREVARAFLEDLGYRVLEAARPSQALALATVHGDAIDLLVTDVVMPEMSGRDLARRLMSEYPGMKCLFMSGYTANVIAHRGILDADVKFVGKPFTRNDLARKVREVVG